MQEAWLTAVECVKACERNNITDDNIVKAKVITWVKNHLINLKLKPILNTVPADEHIMNMADGRDYEYELVELRESLTGKEREIFDLLLQGFERKAIQEKLNLSKSEYYRKIAKIKGTLQG